MTRQDRRYALLKSQNRCGKCAEKLAFEDIGNHVICAACREKAHNAHVEEIKARHANGECSCCGAKLQDNALKTCADCRRRSAEHWRRTHPFKPSGRTECHCGAQIDPNDRYKTCAECRRKRLADYYRDRTDKPRSDGAKWAALERAMTTACERCGLRGDHECVMAAAEFATSRPGGSTFPAPGGVMLTTQERRRIAKVGPSKFSPRALQYKVRRAA